MGTLPRPEKFVLLALADHADHEGGHISPSLGRVALKTGYSYQKVLAIVKGMRETGIIEAVGESEYRTRVYQICFEQLNPLPPYLGRNSLPHSKEWNAPFINTNLYDSPIAVKWVAGMMIDSGAGGR